VNFTRSGEKSATNTKEVKFKSSLKKKTPGCEQEKVRSCGSKMEDRGGVERGEDAQYIFLNRNGLRESRMT